MPTSTLPLKLINEARRVYNDYELQAKLVTTFLKSNPSPDDLIHGISIPGFTKPIIKYIEDNLNHTLSLALSRFVHVAPLVYSIRSYLLKNHVKNKEILLRCLQYGWWEGFKLSELDLLITTVSHANTILEHVPALAHFILSSTEPSVAKTLMKQAIQTKGQLPLVTAFIHYFNPETEKQGKIELLNILKTTGTRYLIPITQVLTDDTEIIAALFSADKHYKTAAANFYYESSLNFDRPRIAHILQVVFINSSPTAHQRQRAKLISSTWKEIVTSYEEHRKDRPSVARKQKRPSKVQDSKRKASPINRRRAK